MQSAIRADGAPSAQVKRGSSMYPVSPVNAAERRLRALRANRAFGADEKRIRTKNTVLNKSKVGFEVLSSSSAAARCTLRCPPNIAFTYAKIFS